MNISPQQLFNNLVEDLPSQIGTGKTVPANNNSRDILAAFKDFEAARQRAAIRRWKMTENLDKYLIEFEANFIKTGGKVLWARNVAEAQQVIAEILKKNAIKEASVFGDAIISEVDLHNCLNYEDIKITPLINRVATAGALIAEASCFIADPGVVVLTDVSNTLQTAIAKSQCMVAVAGICDVLHNLGDLSLYLPLKTAYKNENLNADTALLFGPQANGGDVTNELYLLIIDNGRSNLLADKKTRQAAWCINCGACEQVCPVSAGIGHHAGVYDSPIKAAQMPYLGDTEEYQYLTRATTLCGACSQVCPVHINLHEIFLHNRHKSAALQLTPQKEKWFYLLWKKTMMKRDKFSFGGFKSNRLLMETVYEKVWGIKENQPPFAKKSFNELWKEKHFRV